MSRENLIFNSIFYLILTSFFIYLFINEKKIAAVIEKKRIAFEDCIINKLNMTGKISEKFFRKFSKLVESLGTAIILVLIIQKFYLGNFLVPTGSMEPTIIPRDRLFGNMFLYKFKQPKREDIIVFKEPIENKVLYTKRLMGLPGEKVQIKDDYLFVNGEKILNRNYSSLGEIGTSVWTIPKKGDTVTIVPGQNYKNLFKAENIDIAKVQSLLSENTGYLSQLLPDLKFLLNGEETGMILDFIHDKDIMNSLLEGKEVTKVLDEDYYFVLGDNTNGSYDSRMWGFVKDSRIYGKAFVRFWPLNRMKFLK